MNILHHYDESLFSEKVRAMLGYTGMAWQSVDVPPQPPRPSLDPLLDGYRRIPVMQIGADIFCDTDAISYEIASQASKPELSAASLSPEDREFNRFLEDEIFQACLLAGASLSPLIKWVFKRGPMGLYRFIKDRSSAAQDGGFRRYSREEALAVWSDHVADLENLLADKPFLGGDAPNILDFSAYHVIWMYQQMKGQSAGAAGSNLFLWQARMEAFGHGTSTDLTVEQALDIAKSAQPRAVPDAIKADGRAVSIGPADYMRIGTAGSLVGEDDHIWIIARQTTRAGLIHVHFPKLGFELKA